MTRQQLHQYFPDTYRFFYDVGDDHPFWKAMYHIHLDDARAGATLLSDLEQVFSSLHLVDGHRVIHDHLVDITTHQALMDMLTSLYVAYLYRDHQPRILPTEHGYSVELEIAHQLLALGVVGFHNFDAPQIQFAAQIQDEMSHLHSLTSLEDRTSKHRKEFLQHLRHHAKKTPHHPRAQHQVLAALTHQSRLPAEVELVKDIRNHPEEMKANFPHIAGVVLIDPTPGKEQASFVPFHTSHHTLEQLLNKHP